MAEQRDLDVVVHGATGFVGKLTAEYLARSAPEGVRVGLSGRSRDRLERVRDELGSRAAGWQLLVTDAGERAAVERLAGSTRVVATTVGPYRRYGLPLVEACAAAGTHYVDLTGEVLFMRETIDRADAPARASGARIVHSCGFDSIPSDIGTYLLHQRAQADGAGELESTQLTVMRIRGGVSGGTLASMRGSLDERRSDPAARRLIDDPYALSPDRSAEPDLGPQPDAFRPERDDDLGLWIGPFIMGQINTRVVRRTNALLGFAYGRRFRYRETMSFGAGVRGQATAMGAAGGTLALIGALGFGPTRAVLDRLLPSPGEGPSDEARRKGFFEIEIHAGTAEGARYVSRVAAKGDPGYAATAVMIAESALGLALDEERLPDRTGVLTPATAFGEALAERLRAAGQTFDVRRR